MGENETMVEKNWGVNVRQQETQKDFETVHECVLIRNRQPASPMCLPRE